MITVFVKYKAGHSIDHYYEKCELFCPSCGEQQVWQEQSEGDYYVGETFIGVACEVHFNIQGPHLIADSDEAASQILTVIKAL